MSIFFLSHPAHKANLIYALSFTVHSARAKVIIVAFEQFVPLTLFMGCPTEDCQQEGNLLRCSAP